MSGATRATAFAPARRRRLDVALALLVTLGLAAPAVAWSPDGHRITGEIAWGALAPATRQALWRILPEGRSATLAEAAAWADTVARRDPAYAWVAPLHFVNVDPHARSVREGRDCECVVGAIERERDRLRDPKATRAEKLEALRLLAHFVGDVHQPLHVSHPDGHGGTTVDVSFDGEATTLHRLWDGALLERRLRETALPRGKRRGPRWLRYAHALAERTPAAERERWQATLDPRAWADESLGLARRYTFSVADGAALGDAYYQDAIPVVEQRLAQAGFRLAALLDTVFAGREAVPQR